MSDSGFELRELRFAGTNGLVSRVSFSAGLNVITGASDTGKSFILDCLTYTFGGAGIPRSIPEAKRYQRVAVALLARDVQSVWLERNLHDSGGVMLFPGSSREENADEAGESLAPKHGDNRGRNISEILLEYSGLAEKRIRSSKFPSRELSFRDVAPYVLINENRIIDGTTPMRSTQQYITVAEELSTFDLLITGRDATGLIAPPDRKTVQVSWHARTALYDEMIARLQQEVEDIAVHPAVEKVDRSLDEQIQMAASRLELSSEVLNDAVEQRRRVLRDGQRGEAQVVAARQLVERFLLLRQHYASDKERLQFLNEGDHLLAQLGAEHCPTCGQLISGAGHKREDHTPASNTTMQAAVAGEIEKLDIQIADLDLTLESVRNEEARHRSTVADASDQLSTLATTIQSQLEPVVLATRAEISRLVNARDVAVRFVTKRLELEELRARRKELGKKPPKAVKADPPPESHSERRAFCDAVAATLRAWNYRCNVVEFDTKNDLIVDGEARSSHGKGVKAIIHAAFTVALLRFTRERGLPHPGFVALDSPLTSFKNKDRYEVAEDVQRAFFVDLAAHADQQVVIIENKEPPEDMRSLMTYAHFSGRVGVGRAGLLTV